MDTLSRSMATSHFVHQIENATQHYPIGSISFALLHNNTLYELNADIFMQEIDQLIGFQVV